MVVTAKGERDTLRGEAKIAWASNYAARPLIGDTQFDAARWPQAQCDLMVLGTEFHALARPDSEFLDPQDIAPWGVCAHDLSRQAFII